LRRQAEEREEWGCLLWEDRGHSATDGWISKQYHSILDLSIETHIYLEEMFHSTCFIQRQKHIIWWHHSIVICKI
jgi:hypothetical protein